MTTCVVCKQEIEGYEIVTEQGSVHPGACHAFLLENTMNESENQQNLNEVTLL